MTTPSFDPNVPQFNSDQLAITQPQFLRNFLTLYNAFNENHVPLNDPNQGNHAFVELIQQLNPLQTDPGDINIYTKDVEGQTDQVFFRYQGNGQEFQFTNYQIYSLFQDPKLRTQYFTFLPGRLILYFGYFYSGFPLTYTLKLEPGIATNIASVSTVVFGTVPSVKGQQQYKPVVKNIPENSTGFYDTIVFMGGTPSIGVLNCYYLILANT